MAKKTISNGGHYFSFEQCVLMATVILFTMAMLMGLTLITFYSLDKPRPGIAVALHGPLAISGYVCLIITATMVFSYYLLFAIAFFSIAAPLGAYMFYRDKIRKNPLPSYFPVIHALFAVSGLVCLYAYFLRAYDIWVF